MIGAGACKTPARTAEWLKIAPVVSGSYTPEPREGNSGQVMWPMTVDEFLTMGYGLNGYGMPNMGFASAATQFNSIESEQPLVVSVAGFSVDDYVLGVRTFGALSNVAAIELNFGCPNTQGEHNTIVSFDPDTVWQIMLGIGRLEIEKPIWIKLSPYSDPRDLQRMAAVLNECVGPQPLAVITCNTFPNAYAGKGAVDTNDGLAGLSGPAIKPFALGQVKQFRQQLDERIDVIGVGGITTGDDIIDFLEAGASAVQITSLAHWDGDPRSFQERLLDKETASRFLESITNDT
jgi:dihydroorotate dehydrogenase (fumarate)